MTVRLISTTTEPVTLAEAKATAVIVTSDDDSMISNILIPAARRAAEQETGRSLALSTWEVWLDAFPDEIELPYPPILAISEVTYVDPNGVTQTLSPSAYSLDARSEPGWLLPAFGTAWPATKEIANAVKVRYTAGYGADCPAEVKLWILAQVHHFYDNRSAVLAGTVAATSSLYLDSLLDRARVYA